MVCRVGCVLILVLLLSPAGLASDAYLLGYCRALVERVLQEPEVVLTVEDGVVRVRHAPEADDRRETIRATLLEVDGVEQVLFVERGDSPLETLRDEIDTSTEGLFPDGELFAPLIADPLESRFMLSYRYSDLFNSSMGVAGFGEVLGLYRWRVGEEHRIQLGVEGSSFHYFNFDEKGDIVNSDFFVGLPVTWSFREWSSRFRIMHRSGHYGDEYLFDNTGIVLTAGEDSNVSDHYVDWLLAYSRDTWRVYGGLEYMWDPEPDRDATTFITGAEYTPWPDLSIHPLFGVHLTLQEEFDWHVNHRIVAGVEFRDFPFRNRNLQLLGEYYNGQAIELPFWREEGDYFGVGVYLDL